MKEFYISLRRAMPTRDAHASQDIAAFHRRAVSGRDNAPANNGYYIFSRYRDTFTTTTLITALLATHSF